jgi:hypothetical protein
MFIQELPTDLIISICHGVLHEDTKNKEIGKFKKEILTMITNKNLKISEYICDDDTDAEIIQDFIFNYCKKISLEQKNTIICDYGMLKGMKLFYDFHRLGLGDSYEEICEYFELDDYMINDIIIELIIKDEIGFHSNWRKNSN